MTPTKEELQEMLNSINNTITKLEERRKQLSGSNSSSTTGATSEPGDTFGLDDDDEVISGLTGNESNVIRGNERSVIRGLDSIYTSMSSGNYYAASPEVQANLEALRNATQGLNAALVNAQNNPNGSYSKAFEENLRETGRLIEAQRNLIKAQTNQIKAASKDEQRNNQLQAKLLKEQIEQLKKNLKAVNASAGNNSNARGILDVLKTDMSELFPSIFKTPEEVAAMKQAKEAERAAKAQAKEQQQQQSETEKRNAENFDKNFDIATVQLKPILFNFINQIMTKDNAGNLPDDNTIVQLSDSTRNKLSHIRFSPNSQLTQPDMSGNKAFDTVWNVLKENIKRDNLESTQKEIFDKTNQSIIQYVNDVRNDAPNKKVELYKLAGIDASNEKFDNATKDIKFIFDNTIKQMMTFDDKGSFGDDTDYTMRTLRSLQNAAKAIKQMTFTESATLIIVDDIYQEGLGNTVQRVKNVLNQDVGDMYNTAKANVGNKFDALKHKGEIKRYQDAVQNNTISDKLWNEIKSQIEQSIQPDTPASEIFKTTKNAVVKYFQQIASAPIKYRDDFFKMINVDPNFQQELTQRQETRTTEAEAKNTANAERREAINKATEKLKPLFDEMLNKIREQTNGKNPAQFKSTGVLTEIGEIVRQYTTKVVTIQEQYILESGIGNVINNMKPALDEKFATASTNTLWNDEILKTVQDPNIPSQDIFKTMKRAIVSLATKFVAYPGKMLDKLYNKKEGTTDELMNNPIQNIHLDDAQRSAVEEGIKEYKQYVDGLKQELLKADDLQAQKKILEDHLNNLTTEFQTIEIVDDVYLEANIISSALQTLSERRKAKKAGNLAGWKNRSSNVAYTSICTLEKKDKELFDFIAKHVQENPGDPRDAALEIVYRKLLPENLIKPAIQNVDNTISSTPAPTPAGPTWTTPTTSA